MGRINTLVVIAVVASFLSACSGGPSPSQKELPPTAAEENVAPKESSAADAARDYYLVVNSSKTKVAATLNALPGLPYFQCANAAEGPIQVTGEIAKVAKVAMTRAELTDIAAVLAGARGRINGRKELSEQVRGQMAKVLDKAVESLTVMNGLKFYWGDLSQKVGNTVVSLPSGWFDAAANEIVLSAEARFDRGRMGRIDLAAAVLHVLTHKLYPSSDPMKGEAHASFIQALVAANPERVEDTYIADGKSLTAMDIAREMKDPGGIALRFLERQGDIAAFVSRGNITNAMLLAGRQNARADQWKFATSTAAQGGEARLHCAWPLTEEETGDAPAASLGLPFVRTASAEEAKKAYASGAIVGDKAPATDRERQAMAAAIENSLDMLNQRLGVYSPNASKEISFIAESMRTFANWLRSGGEGPSGIYWGNILGSLTNGDVVKADGVYVSKDRSITLDNRFTPGTPSGDRHSDGERASKALHEYVHWRLSTLNNALGGTLSRQKMEEKAYFAEAVALTNMDFSFRQTKVVDAKASSTNAPMSGPARYLLDSEVNSPGKAAPFFIDLNEIDAALLLGNPDSAGRIAQGIDLPYSANFPAGAAFSKPEAAAPSPTELGGIGKSGVGQGLPAGGGMKGGGGGGPVASIDPNQGGTSSNVGGGFRESGPRSGEVGGRPDTGFGPGGGGAMTEGGGFIWTPTGNGGAMQENFDTGGNLISSTEWAPAGNGQVENTHTGEKTGDPFAGTGWGSGEEPEGVPPEDPDPNAEDDTGGTCTGPNCGQGFCVGDMDCGGDPLARPDYLSRPGDLREGTREPGSVLKNNQGFAH